MSDGNRFESYVGQVYQAHEDQERQRREAKEKRELELQRAHELAQVNELRRQTHEGSSPADLWGPEAAILCDEFLEFAIKASGDRRNLIAATYLRGEDPKEEYVTYKGIFLNKPVIDTRVTGIGWRMSGYPIAYTDVKAQSTSGSTDRDPLIVPKPDIFLCKDGFVRQHNHPIDLISEDKIKEPIFVDWVRNRNVKTVVSYNGKEQREETKVYDFSLDFTTLGALEGLDKRLKELALQISDGALNNAPDEF